jgi:hypothetical protein
MTVFAGKQNSITAALSSSKVMDGAIESRLTELWPFAVIAFALILTFGWSVSVVVFLLRLI